MVHETSEPDWLPDASPRPIWVAVMMILSGDNIQRPLIGKAAVNAPRGAAPIRADGPAGGVAPFRNRALTETFGAVLFSHAARTTRETTAASAKALLIQLLTR